jgi:hypothetical protein
MAWTRRSPRHHTSLLFALASFSLVTVSLGIAVWAMLYARKIGGFPHYSPLLMRIFRSGLGLSLAAVIIAFQGLPPRSTNRRLLLTLSLGPQLFWFLTMMGE